MLNQSGSARGRSTARPGFIRLLDFNKRKETRFVAEMALSTDKLKNYILQEYGLSEQDLRTLLSICTEFANLCARMTGKIDPAATDMLTNVMDVIISGNKSKLQ